MDYITVGEIVKAQGIKGEIKIRSLTDDPIRFKKLKLVYIDNVPQKILSCRIDGTFVYITLSGVETRDGALSLVGKEVNIDRVNAVALPEGGYFITDIIGCRLTTDDGAFLGVITDVGQYGAADVITAKNDDGKILRFPFLNRLVHKIDTENKIFCVIKNQLDGVCVYDD